MAPAAVVWGQWGKSREHLHDFFDQFPPTAYMAFSGTFWGPLCKAPTNPPGRFLGPGGHENSPKCQKQGPAKKKVIEESEK